MRAALFSCASVETLDPQLQRYLQSEVPQSARYSDVTKCFHYTKDGREVMVGGIHNWLRTLYYPDHKSNRSKRNHGRTALVGSTKEQGQRVDAELQLAVEGRKPEGRKRWHPMTAALLQWWRSRGHVLQACQVPVELANGWSRMTKADVITRSVADGKLWLWEVKTGWPVGFYLSSKEQPTFSGAKFGDIRCTEENVWYLQLHYTHQALETMAGLRIEGGARIIQVYARKGQKQLLVEERVPPPWLTTRVPLRVRPLEGVPVVVLGKRTTRPEDQDQ